MATTPIVEIPVDDSGFQKFAAAFRDYDELLKKQPPEWASLNQRITELAAVQRRLGASADKAWSNATSAAVAYERTVKQAAAAQARLGRMTTSAASAMHRMERSAKAVSGHLFSAVRLATKLGVLGAGGGLLGLGGLTFGLDRLAGDVLNRQRTARSVGLTVGQYRSFQINMQRYAGIGLLDAAANAQANPAQWGYLPQAGIPIAEARGESPTRLAEQMVMAAHKAWRANPTVLNPQVMALEHLGMSLGAIRTAGAASAASLRGAIANTHADVGMFSLSRGMQKEWSDFAIQLRKAGAAIDTDLIRGLVSLSGPLGKLSVAVEKDVQAFFNSGAAKDAVNEFAKAIGWAAKGLSSGKFKQDIASFLADMDAAAKRMHHVLVDMGIVPSAKAKFENNPNVQGTPAWYAKHPDRQPNMGFVWRNGDLHWGDRNPQGVPPAQMPPALKQHDALVTGASAAWAGTTKAAYMSGLAASRGLPAGLLSAVYRTESGGNDSAVSAAGAEGGFQFMPGTARQYGMANPFDFGQAAQGAARMLAVLERRFHGNLAMALAAYDWGPGNVRRDVAAHGAAWRDYLPGETKTYIAKVEGMLPRPRGAVAASPAPAAASGSRPDSDIARVRGRYWATHQKQQLNVTGDTAGRTFTLANAAAI